MQPTTYLKVIHNTAQINQTDPHNSSHFILK